MKQNKHLISEMLILDNTLLLLLV